MVSVAIPVYRTKYLPGAIESVLNQTHRDFELIVVNDGSPEDVKSVVSRYKDDRIRYFENPKNLGKENPARNWNKCLSYAKGEHFALFADDDVYDSTFLEEMFGLSIRFPEADIVHCRVRIIDGNGSTLTLSPTCPVWESGIEFVWHRIKGLRVQYAPDFLSRTDALREIGGFVEFPLAWGSDDATWFMLATRGGVAYSSQALCSWRYAEGSISRSGDAEQRLKAIDEFAAWSRAFLANLVRVSAEDELLLGDAQKYLPKHTEELKQTVLVRTGLKRKGGALLLVMEWFRWRRIRLVTLKTLLKSVLYVLSHNDSKELGH